MYQPEWIIYSLEYKAKLTGDWISEYVATDLLLILANAIHKGEYSNSVPWRIVKKDTRPIDPRKDHAYLKPSVIWVSKPTFPQDVDYWKP